MASEVFRVPETEHRQQEGFSLTSSDQDAWSMVTVEIGNSGRA